MQDEISKYVYVWIFLLIFLQRGKHRYFRVLIFFHHFFPILILTGYRNAWSTERKIFMRLLTHEPVEQLRVIFDEYRRMSGQSMQEGWFLKNISFFPQ